MDLALMQRVFPFFLEAALVTIQISALALLLGLVVAALAASAKLSRSAPVRMIGTVYVSVWRGTPCLIQLFILYFGGPQIGINLEPFAAGVIGLGMNIGAYMAESIRGAVLAVDRGQAEAARTIGFGRLDTMRRVILPQAARLMIRPLGVNAVALVKGSALVSMALRMLWRIRGSSSTRKTVSMPHAPLGGTGIGDLILGNRRVTMLPLLSSLSTVNPLSIS